MNDAAAVISDRPPTRSRKVMLTVLAVLAIAGLVALPFFLRTYQIGIATQILIFAVLGMSIDVLAGFSGRTPLCHGAIFGTSTYFVIYRDRKSTRLNSSHPRLSRMPSSA